MKKILPFVAFSFALTSCGASDIERVTLSNSKNINAEVLVNNYLPKTTELNLNSTPNKLNRLSISTSDIYTTEYESNGLLIIGSADKDLSFYSIPLETYIVSNCHYEWLEYDVIINNDVGFFLDILYKNDKYLIDAFGNVVLEGFENLNDYNFRTEQINEKVYLIIEDEYETVNYLYVNGSLTEVDEIEHGKNDPVIDEDDSGIFEVDKKIKLSLFGSKSNAYVVFNSNSVITTFDSKHQALSTFYVNEYNSGIFLGEIIIAQKIIELPDDVQDYSFSNGNKKYELLTFKLDLLKGEVSSYDFRYVIESSKPYKDKNKYYTYNLASLRKITNKKGLLETKEYLIDNKGNILEDLSGEEIEYFVPLGKGNFFNERTKILYNSELKAIKDLSSYNASLLQGTNIIHGKKQGKHVLFNYKGENVFEISFDHLYFDDLTEAQDFSIRLLARKDDKLYTLNLKNETYRQIMTFKSITRIESGIFKVVGKNNSISIVTPIGVIHQFNDYVTNIRYWILRSGVNSSKYLYIKTNNLTYDNSYCGISLKGFNTIKYVNNVLDNTQIKNDGVSYKRAYKLSNSIQTIYNYKNRYQLYLKLESSRPGYYLLYKDGKLSTSLKCYKINPLAVDENDLLEEEIYPNASGSYRILDPENTVFIYKNPSRTSKINVKISESDPIIMNDEYNEYTFEGNSNSIEFIAEKAGRYKFNTTSYLYSSLYNKQDALNYGNDDFIPLKKGINYLTLNSYNESQTITITRDEEYFDNIDIGNYATSVTEEKTFNVDLYKLHDYKFEFTNSSSEKVYKLTWKENKDVVVYSGVYEYGDITYSKVDKEVYLIDSSIKYFKIKTTANIKDYEFKFELVEGLSKIKPFELKLNESLEFNNEKALINENKNKLYLNFKSPLKEKTTYLLSINGSYNSSNSVTLYIPSISKNVYSDQYGKIYYPFTLSENETIKFEVSGSSKNETFNFLVSNYDNSTQENALDLNATNSGVVIGKGTSYFKYTNTREQSIQKYFTFERKNSNPSFYYSTDGTIYNTIYDSSIAFTEYFTLAANETIYFKVYGGSSENVYASIYLKTNNYEIQNLHSAIDETDLQDGSFAIKDYDTSSSGNFNFLKLRATKNGTMTFNYANSDSYYCSFRVYRNNYRVDLSNTEGKYSFLVNEGDIIDFKVYYNSYITIDNVEFSNIKLK